MSNIYKFWRPEVLLFYLFFFFIRNYIAHNYKAIRESPANIIVRECENSQPIAIATYAYGIEQRANLKKLS